MQVLEKRFTLAETRIDEESLVPLIPNLYEDIKNTMIAELRPYKIDVKSIIEYYEDAYFCGVDY